jgi:hypothetical protein
VKLLVSGVIWSNASTAYDVVSSRAQSVQQIIGEFCEAVYSARPAYPDARRLA